MRIGVAIVTVIILIMIFLVGMLINLNKKILEIKKQTHYELNHSKDKTLLVKNLKE